MRKTFILVGMLVIGYANAQEGNVGVNTDQPKATLDIQPSAKNLAGTTNEGILAPRLSKTRIAAISTPVEGTLVYATDESTSPISAYTGTDTKVAKITEKGYYFYNGTEWVKAGNDVNSQIWQKQNDNTILLTDSNIENTVKYSSTGNYVNIPKTLRQVSFWNNGIIETKEYKLNEHNTGNSANLNIFYADKIKEDYLHPSYKEKALSVNHLIIDEQSSSSQINRFFTQKNILQTNEASTKDFPSLYAAVNSAQHFGTGKVSYALMGVFNYAQLHNGSANRVVGAYNQATSRVSSHLPYMEGTFSYVTPVGSGTINDLFGTRNHLLLSNQSSNKIANAMLNRNYTQILEGFSGTIDNLIGSSTYFEIPQAYKGVKNLSGIKIGAVVYGQESNYGLHIGDVGNTTATNNYSIHTGAGKVRLGDLAKTGAGDRVVVADENGVLKAGGSINANNGMQNVDAMECNAENRGKMNFVPGGDGKSDVFGICMKNKNGNYYWGYMVGGNNPTNGTGAFGNGVNN